VKNYTVRRYNSEDSALWNAFIRNAKNATFLFHRDFMEYHSDRFEDFSLLVFEEKKLVSVVPANRVQNTVYSHQGLTYGGFVFNDKIKIGKVIAVMQCALKFLNESKIDIFQLKLIPSIYHTFFSEEIEYTLFLTHAKLTRRDCLSVLDLTKEILYSKIRKRGIKKGQLNSLNIIEEDDLSGFWNEILLPNLALKHHVQPVHSLSEISLLRQKFSNNIRQFNIYHKDKIVAGTTVFVTDNVVHAQYISGNEDKNKLRKAIKHIAHKNSKMLPEFKAKYPDCIYSDSKKSDQYNKIIIEAMGGSGNEDFDNENKIIRKIAKEVTINKS
jgi:hypothetical protein